MYEDRTRKKWKIAVIGSVIAVFIVLIGIFVAGSPAVKGSGEDAESSIRQAVLNCALQCYAVEGAYPPGLDYLQEHYGLKINTTDYYVIYDAFAQNQMPDVRVTRRVH